MAFDITRGTVAKPQKVLIYGPEGVGKSTLAAQFPKPLFVDTEDGTGALDVARLPRPTTWQMLLDEVTWVRDFPAECGGTLVVDTLDWAQALCVSHVCRAKGIDGIEDAGYGRGYTYVVEEFGKLLALLDGCVSVGLNVCALAHACITKFEQPDEMGAYDRWGLKLIDGRRASVAALAKEWADAVLFANFKTVVITDKDGRRAKAQGGRSRVIHATHDAAWDAKNRWGMPDEVPMEWASVAPFVPTPSLGEPQTIGAAPRGAHAGGRADIGGLRDLMTADLVSEAQLRWAMAQAGYVTEDTPLDSYAPDLVGYVVSSWPKIREFIRKSGEAAGGAPDGE